MAAVVSRMQTPVGPQASPEALPARAVSLEPCAPLCRRSTSRARVERSLTGLRTDLEQTHCDTSAAAVAGTSTARLQPLVTDATWESQALDQPRVTALVAQSPPHGLLRLDDTGLPKQGRRSVGVARQSAGTLGKVAKCQVGVSAPYVADEPPSSAPLQGPLTARLALPEGWAADRARRPQGRVPPDVVWQTKPELALALVDQARPWGVPWATVVPDAGYGDQPTGLQGLDDRHGADVVGVSRPVGGRQPEELRVAARTPAAAPRGRGPPQQPRPAPRYAAKAVIEALPADR